MWYIIYSKNSFIFAYNIFAFKKINSILNFNLYKY